MIASNALDGVSRETHERLRLFETLVRKWTPRINLIAPSTRDDIWNRHILDSAQLWPLVPKGFNRWVDLGAGGGFPGIVLAVLAAEENPPPEICLVESDQRKCVFLRNALREIGVAGTVISQRSEDIPPLDAAVVSARALAPLDRLIPMARRHLNDDGILLAPKGGSYNDEIHSALESWGFDCEKFSSATSSDSAILRISRIRRVG